jgi:hypothetical protein
MDFYEATGRGSYDRREMRRQAKAKAFAALREHKGKVFLGALVATLPAIFVTILTQWQSIQETMLTYGSMQEQTLMTAASSSSPLATVLIELLQIFALMPLSIGLYHLFTALLRKEPDTSVNLIFSRFQSGRRYWTSVKLAIMVTIYSIFWSIPVTAICIAPFLVVVRNGTMHMAAGMVCLIAGCILVFFMLLFYMAKVQTYTASYLISLDYEERRARELFFAARVLYQGHIFEMMVFLLSFIGWYIAPVVVLSALMVMIGMTMVTSASLTVAMIVLAAVVGIVVMLYCIWISAYQSMAFICLTTQLRVRSGDTTAMTPEEKEAYLRWRAQQQGQQSSSGDPQ